MRNQRKLAVAELLAFLENYSLRTIVVENKPFTSLLTSLYRGHHALLVWHVNLECGTIWTGNYTKDATFREYLKEAVSDICQSILLFSQGLYKPAYLMLRSAVENFVRCVGIAEDQAVLKLTSVFDLLTVVRDTPAVSRSDNMRRAFVTLRRVYSELCSYVHSSDHEFMSLTAYLGVYPKFDQPRAAQYIKVCKSVSVSSCSMLALLLPTQLRGFHHRDMDLIADVLPRRVKIELHAA